MAKPLHRVFIGDIVLRNSFPYLKQNQLGSVTVFPKYLGKQTEEEERELEESCV